MNVVKYTNEYRREKWLRLINVCNASGKAKTAWCQENNVNIKSFYYWQHKIKSELLLQSSESQDIVPIMIQQNEQEDSYILINDGAMSLKLPANVSLDALETIIKALK